VTVKKVGRTAKAKRAGKGAAGAELEVPGLVLLALGVLVLGLVLPLPTGQLGALLRELVVGRVGVGAYLLPWPPLVLGGLFLLRQRPRNWPRLLLGYAVTGLGVWLLLALLWPSLGGSWGGALHTGAGGATGVLATLLALLVILLGIDILLGLPPTTLLRSGTRRSVLGVQGALHRGAHVRRKVKTRAAFGADVAIVKKRLRALSSDLGALGELYPGSAELGKWQEVVKGARGNLRWADAEILADTETDVDAWEEAVAGFTRARAAELAAQVGDEGLRDFEAQQDALTDTLSEPLTDRTLDGVRKLLGLEATALGERYSRLLRERDLSAEALGNAAPKALVRASRAHAERTAQFAEVAQAQEALATDAALLAPWEALLERLTTLHNDYPGETALETFDAELHTLLKRGRPALAELDAQTEALDALEASLGLVTAAPPEAADEPVGEPAQEDALEAELPWNDDAGEVETDDTPDDTPDSAPRFGVLTEPEEAELEPIPEVGGIPIQLPPMELLDAPEHTHDDPAAQNREVRARITKIDETLANFRLQGRVVASVRGPTVTRFEVEPAPGEKISRFSGLSDDLALAMAVGSVRIEAPIPGKSVIGLEVPNAQRDLIKFREAAEAPPFRRAKARLPLILGKSIDGEMVVGDLARMPHLLIAGSTGSGKSVAVNTLVGSLLYRFLPTDLRFLMIDPKMVELTPFDGVPHLLRPVVTNPNDASGVLLGLVAHMERRYKMMSKIGAKNLDQYNQKARTLDMPELPFIIIIIDELADLMITSPKEVESAIMRLAQMARATGMHLVLATQRPSVDILTSLIKVNVPARIAFAVSSGHDSRTILDTMGAERLTGMGDMLFYQPGLVKPVRLQGPFISEDEIFTLASFLRRQYFDDDFVEAYGSDFDPPPADESSASGLIDWNDDKLREAAELVITEGQASVSRLQRRLSVGHARAGKLMDSLEALGVVGTHSGSKPRDVLVELDELPEIFGK
jgi:S-DNA-T family DNA segregation ATPase FtsK/SpoIIIE